MGLNKDILTDLLIREFGEYTMEYAGTSKGYAIEVSMSWDFLNGYNNPDLVYDVPMTPGNGKTISYWLQFNDNDNEERSKVGTTPGAWVQVDPKNNIMLLKDPTINASSGVFSDLGISVYPNPVGSQLNISAKENLRSLEIINMTGTSIKSYVNVDSKIDVSDLTKGLYIIKVTTATGQQAHSKILIE
ncbi:MAG: T9SS type A sorting domain-containing protein [Bacteroidales bacterium]|nr:T9SS type A sorting domain-containing protein [Bacteroidales bacterium]